MAGILSFWQDAGYLMLLHAAGIQYRDVSMNEQLFVLANQKKKTNHILHLLLCIPTAGFWLIAWVLIGMQNSMHNSSIDRKMNRIVNHKIEGRSDIETYKAIRAEDQLKGKVLLTIIAVVIFFIWLANRH
ncbi:hypothetical protein CCL19_22715 [Pseudomonas syringae]|nr:hypothetical protein [Pseudomonas syringae]PBP60211.1 hypothetical protein CCL19_22715 [Pseudomonas syringae]SDS28864.1 hypothetical protein SAMN05421724_1090 [Pseudomonas syringae]